MMMLFVLNGDNDDRDENGEEEEACFGAETRRSRVALRAVPPDHRRMSTDTLVATDDNKHDCSRKAYVLYFVPFYTL